MSRTLNHLHALVAALFVCTGAVARADELICANNSYNPGTGEDWGVACYGSSWAYASVEVSEVEQKVTVHVTDHFDCPSGTHLECGFGSSFDGEFACVREGVLELDAEGYVPAVVVYCGCYAVNCYGE